MSEWYETFQWSGERSCAYREAPSRSLRVLILMGFYALWSDEPRALEVGPLLLLCLMPNAHPVQCLAQKSCSGNIRRMDRQCLAPPVPRQQEHMLVLLAGDPGWAASGPGPAPGPTLSLGMQVGCGCLQDTRPDLRRVLRRDRPGVGEATVGPLLTASSCSQSTRWSCSWKLPAWAPLNTCPPDGTCEYRACVAPFFFFFKYLFDYLFDSGGS